MSNNRTFQNDRQPRMLSNDLVATGDDTVARYGVFSLGAPRVIIIKINSKDTLGLPVATTTAEELKQKLESHRTVAQERGIDADAFRDRAGLTHNGVRVYEEKARVRLNELVIQMSALGYRLINASWFQKAARPGKRAPDPTVHLAFSLTGEAIEMTERVKKFLDEAFVDGFHLWCNPKKDVDGTWFRLDTLNGFAGQVPKNPAASPGYTLTYLPPEAGETGYELE